MTICSSKVFTALILIILSVSQIPVNAQVEFVQRENRQVDPILVFDDFEKAELNLSQGFTFHPLTTFLTGPNYYHRLTVSIIDDIARIFDTDEFYRIIYNLDLIGTIFNPSDKEILVEEGRNGSIMLDFDTEVNYQLNLTSNIVSISNQNTTVTMTTSIQTYFVDDKIYNFETTIYEITTRPVRMNFTTNGSFTWQYLPLTHILVDENMLINETYDFTLKIHIQILESIDPGDRIRIESSGKADTYRVEDGGVVEISEIPIQAMTELEVSTLSGPMQFQISSVFFILNPYGLSEGRQQPTLPDFGWIFALIMYGLSYLLVYKFMQIKERMEQEGSK